MKLVDLRKIVKSKKKVELEELVIKLYKLVPKAKLESSNIDLEIDSNQIFIEPAPQNNALAEAKLVSEINYFIENFLAQNYGIPNRIVPKAKRSKWRFEVMGYIKEIDKLWNTSENKKELADIYTQLYKAICTGCHSFLVSSENPFASIRLSQIDFLSKVVLYLHQVYSGDELHNKIIRLLEFEGTSYDTTYSDLYWGITSTLNNPLFLEELYEKLWKRYELNKAEFLNIKKKDRYFSSYELVKQLEGLIIVSVALLDFEKVNKIVQEECTFYDDKKEMIYYIATKILKKPYLKAQKHIFSLLTDAKDNKVELRGSLIKLLRELDKDINKDLSNFYL